MEITVQASVYSAERTAKNATIHLESAQAVCDLPPTLTQNCIAYPPFINSHDHLVGNWDPRAGDNRPYSNTDIWVEEMKYSASYLERNKVWINDGTFRLLEGTAYRLYMLGCYKNLFSGCVAVQDHGPNQKPAYYDSFPIHVIRDYRQCHSISLGNWWGGKSAREEWESTNGEMPFITHLAEGTDERSKSCYPRFKELGLAQPNTLIVHGIAMTPEDIADCAANGVSICVCPESNIFLIGKTIDMDACRKYGVNVVIGTDSTMSGSTNILTEIRRFREIFPHIPANEIFAMITANAQRALLLDDSYGTLQESNKHLLLMAAHTSDPYENLFHSTMHDVELLVYDGTPIYGNAAMLNHFHHDPADYFFFAHDGHKRFVKGHPEKISAEIDAALGYHKHLPYIPY